MGDSAEDPLVNTEAGRDCGMLCGKYIAGLLSCGGLERWEWSRRMLAFVVLYAVVIAAWIGLVVAIRHIPPFAWALHFFGTLLLTGVVFSITPRYVIRWCTPKPAVTKSESDVPIAHAVYTIDSSMQ